MRPLKIVIFALIIALICAFIFSDAREYLSLTSIKLHQDAFAQIYKNNPIESILAFSGIYIIATALSFPGATILTLLAGALFGTLIGSIIVSIASTIGATLAFLLSRLLFKDFIQNKFSEKLISVNEGLKKDGIFYILTLRLVPAFPFFLVNILLGLTPISVFKYFTMSMIGMLPATIVYVNAGTQLANIETINGIISKEILLSFTILGLFPLIVRFFIQTIKSKNLYRKFKKPKSFKYNLIVIGGGAAGLVTSYIAAALRAKVLLIEKNKMGGDCLYTGCIPSKSLIKSAHFNFDIKNFKKYGFKSASVEFNFSDIKNRIQNIIKKIEPHDSPQRYESLGVECINGNAEIVSPYEVSVNNQIFTTKNIVIASGAEPIVPKIPGLEKIKYLTSENIWELEELPKKLVIVGSGAIGCELAQAFQRLGSQVILIERNARILAREDSDVSEFIAKKFTHEGIKIYLNSEIQQIKTINQKQFLVINHAEVEFEQILFAIGRKARSQQFSQLNLSFNTDGTIATDLYLRTIYPNVYACGDIVGPYQFTHMAAHQAWYCAVNSLFSPFWKFKVNYSAVPFVTYTDPEIARVGLDETQAKKLNIETEIAVYNLESLDRAITESQNEGWVKVIIKKGSDKILGATIVGARAGEMLAEFTLAIKNNIGLNKILTTIHPYPTWSEGNKFAAGNWRKQNAPEGALKLLKKFHQFKL